MSTLLLVPLEDVVVFPGMNVTLPVDTAGEERVLLVPVHERRVRRRSAPSPRSATSSGCPAASARRTSRACTAP